MPCKHTLTIFLIVALSLARPAASSSSRQSSGTRANQAGSAPSAPGAGGTRADGGQSQGGSNQEFDSGFDQADSAQAAAGKSDSAGEVDGKTLLKGGLVENVSPFLKDALPETIKQGTTVNLTLTANINSELSNVGDQVHAMVSVDLKNGKKVLLPGQWFVRGKVTRVERQRRLGRDGYIQIKFDKLISPDGKYEVPVDAVVSTKDSAVKAVAKHVVKDSAYVGVGAVGGAIASVQLTGIPLAVATHGYSVAVGGAAGAGLGAIAAARRKGKILSVVAGDELSFKLDKPLVLPAFNPEAVPSAAPPPRLEGLDVTVSKSHFKPDPCGDRLSRLLVVSFRIKNKTSKEVCLSNIAAISDHNQMYYPYASPANIQERMKRVAPNATLDAVLTFGVGSPKHVYSLVVLDVRGGNILSQVAIN